MGLCKKKHRKETTEVKDMFFSQQFAIQCLLTHANTIGMVGEDKTAGATYDDPVDKDRAQE